MAVVNFVDWAITEAAAMAAGTKDGDGAGVGCKGLHCNCGVVAKAAGSGWPAAVAATVTCNSAFGMVADGSTSAPSSFSPCEMTASSDCEQRLGTC